MNKHTAIRLAVMEKLKASVSGQITFFDGRPVSLEGNELPALAVYLSDIEYMGDSLNEDNWKLVLHIEIFLKPTSTDSALDTWMEEQVCPAINNTPELLTLIETISPIGYSYQHDDEMANWRSVDLKYILTYLK